MSSRRHYRHGEDQVPTIRVSITEIMKDPAFALGVEDYRAGRAPRDMAASLGAGVPLKDYRAATNANWNYERGRQWAAVAPRWLLLRIAGELNPKAIRYYQGIR